LASPAFAQATSAPTGAPESNPPKSNPPKAHAKKTVPKPTEPGLWTLQEPTKAPAGKGQKQLSPEEQEKADRLAEGRKKFFDSSSGFDSGGFSPPTSGGSPGSARGGGGDGFNPGVGLKF